MPKYASALWSLAFFSLVAAPAPARAETITLGAGAATVHREERVDPVSGRQALTVAFHLRALRKESRLLGGKAYHSVGIDQLPLTSNVGEPALPFQAVTLNAGLEEILVRAELGKGVAVSAGEVLPAQLEPCRCATPRAPAALVDHVKSYRAPASGFRLESLGDFRGQPVSRVILLPHRYDPQSGQLLVYPEARFEISYRTRPTPRVESAYDFLVVSPRAWLASLEPWVSWKQSAESLRFRLVALEDLNASGPEAFRDWVHAEYAKANFRYALLVGGNNVIPQMTVVTTTDAQTPSDLPYFTMGGASDVIPDVYAARMVVDGPAGITRIVRKWLAYERGAGDAAGWRRAVGIASNQGSNPSDADYVTSILDKFKAAQQSESIYLFENNADSTPANFNQQLAAGASWVTYVGHGSGTSWPSFGQEYNIEGIQALRNAGAVKPVWIDVACLNGKLESGAAGAHLTAESDPAGQPTGVAAYVGGTVLVSWNPPAIFARGVAYRATEMVHPTLGEAIQAGQRYLTENVSSLEDIASNQRWYHLQGDPSMRLRLP